MIFKKEPYVAYYKISEDDNEKNRDLVAMPNCNAVAYPINLNKQTDDHQMTGGTNGD